MHICFRACSPDLEIGRVRLILLLTLVLLSFKLFFSHIMYLSLVFVPLNERVLDAGLQAWQLPIALRSQVYSLVKERTVADRELENLRSALLYATKYFCNP